MKFVIFKFKNLNFLIEKFDEIRKMCLNCNKYNIYWCFDKYLTFNITTTKYTYKNITTTTKMITNRKFIKEYLVKYFLFDFFIISD